MEYPWGHQRRFNDYAGYFRKQFGERLQKVSIDAGFTCPNRDGTVGIGGCTYCNNNAFNPSYCSVEKTVTRQIQEGIAFHKKRYRRAVKYLAYFQAYSNTYAELPVLKSLYEEALAVEDVVGLVIGTRPDCVDDAILDYLAGLKNRVYVIVEYGIESCYNHTLERVNRGHTFEQTVRAIRETAARGIRTGGHLIFGLPGETREEMLEEAVILSRLPLSNIKFHQLQIIRNTRMADEYRNHPEHFRLFGPEEYVEFVCDFLERLNPAFVVERFAGEAPPGYITGPRWGFRYDTLVRKVETRLEERGTWQGALYTG